MIMLFSFFFFFLTTYKYVIAISHLYFESNMNNVINIYINKNRMQNTCHYIVLLKKLFLIRPYIGSIHKIFS